MSGLAAGLFNSHQSLLYQRDYYLLAGFYDKLVARIESRARMSCLLGRQTLTHTSCVRW